MGCRKRISEPFPFENVKTDSDKCKAQGRSCNVAEGGGQKISNSEPPITHLIHILAKHETPMNARRTVLGRVPAMLNTLVMRTRSMAVLLRADAIVNPPINSMIVGENMTEKMYLYVMRVTQM